MNWILNKFLPASSFHFVGHTALFGEESHEIVVIFLVHACIADRRVTFFFFPLFSLDRAL